MKLTLLILAAQAVFGQMPKVVDAKAETRSGANLAATFREIVASQEAPAWVGYAVTAVPGNRDGGCWFDGNNGGHRSSPVMLEGSPYTVMLYRIANHRVEKMQPISAECELDGGGLPFIELTGVRPAESVELLKGMVKEKGDRAMVMIAQHGDASAVEALLDLAKNDAAVRVRGQALFWLAHRAGARETAAIVTAVSSDPDLEVKKKAVFALAQIPHGEGVPKLIDVARNNRTPEVRKQAMFWLGQSKDPRAVAFFEQILTGR